MKEIPRTAREAKTRPELVEIVLWRQAQGTELRARVEELTKPPPPSPNSSLPPARDYQQ